MLNWFAPSKPADLKPVPWLSQNATSYFETVLSPNMEVLEFGSGGSTLWLSERVKYVTSVENDYQWMKEVKAQAGNNVLMLMDLSYISRKRQFDMVFIDGEPVGLRADWIQAAPFLVCKDGWVVLDNANRPEYALEREGLSHHADLIQTVNGNSGGTRYLVTEFWRVR